MKKPKEQELMINVTKGIVGVGNIINKDPRFKILDNWQFKNIYPKFAKDLLDMTYISDFKINKYNLDSVINSEFQRSPTWVRDFLKQNFRTFAGE